MTTEIVMALRDVLFGVVASALFFFFLWLVERTNPEEIRRIVREELDKRPKL